MSNTIIKKIEREPFDLPFVDKENHRAKLVKIYSERVWRISDMDKLQHQLDHLYEAAYSNGLIDKDRMEKRIIS